MSLTTLSYKGNKIQLDIMAELDVFSWENVRSTKSKLISSSPFRNDSSPSFFVNLETGGWGDSGAHGTTYESGNFFELLGYLRGTSDEEAFQYLKEKYGLLYRLDRESDRIVLERPELAEELRERYVNLSDLVLTDKPSMYLRSRSISDKAMLNYGVGRNPSVYGYVALPWYRKDGMATNIKYRKTSGKNFFYEKGGEPISRLLYGENRAYDVDTLIICEAEIDALSWYTAGYNAVATGSANITKEQVRKLRRLGMRNLVLAGDNDKQGQAFNNKVYRYMRGVCPMYYINFYAIYGGRYKDSNDVLVANGKDGLANLFRNKKKLNIFVRN